MLVQAEWRMQAEAAGVDGGMQARPVVDFDGQLDCAEVSPATLKALVRLSPLRADGAEPLLLFRNARVAGVQTVKKGEHLKLTLRGGAGRGTVMALAWNRGAEASCYPVGTRIDLAAYLVSDTHGGLLNVQLNVQEIRASSTNTIITL